MELNIPNPDCNDFCEAVGISPERQKELSESLDEMVRQLNSGPVKLVKMHDVFAQIASYCKTPEELVYCTVLHCGWHARKGKVLAPGPLNYGVIGLAIQMLYDRMRKEFTKESREIMGLLVATKEENDIKDGCRKGIQYLLDLKEFELAKDIINKLTGFAF